MRVGLFISFFILSSSLLGQSIYDQSIKLKGGALELASIKDTLKPHHLILAFADDAGERWKNNSWAQELYWLAEERNALVVSPNTKDRKLTWPEIDAVIQFFKDSVQSIDKTEFIALGSGARNTSDLIDNGFSGLLISPILILSLVDLNKPSAVGLIKTLEVDSSQQLIDSLSHSGNWVLFDQQFGSDYYYIDGYKQLYLDVFNKIDSLNSDILRDTLQEFKTKVVGSLPDVVRQGQKVEISIIVYQNGDYLLDLLDLSAKSVFHKELYLGKGKHSFYLKTNDLDWGVYKVQISGSKFLYKHKLMIRG